MKFLKTLSVFVGTIIGVGIFGLPYVASKAGFFVVLAYFLFMSGVAITIHLILGEISLSEKKLRRLPGHVGEYLGDRWKKVTLVVFGFGIIGALLAYLIVGGEFLTLFLSPYFGGSSLVYTLLFFAAGTILIFLGIKSIAQIDLSLLVVLFVILAIFFIRAFPFVNLDYLKDFNFKFFTFPYGVVLFSLWGLAIVPELKEMLDGKRELLRKVIISGILLSTAVYVFFVFIIFGVSGSSTSKEAISGFAFILGDGVIKLGFLFGLITCFTSFIVLGLTLKKTLWYDFNLPKNFSWFVTWSLPLVLFILGFREFIDIISLIGAFAIGFEAIMVVFLYREFLKKKFSAKMNPLIYALVAVFTLGIVSEIVYLGLIK